MRVAARKRMDGLNGQGRSLRLEHVGEGCRHHARRRIAGGTGHDEAGARGPNDKDPIDRPRIKSGAPFLLGGVGRELQRARRGRRE